MVAASIIIPTYNRADSLRATLSSIAVQRNLENYEVIVVDNGSTDHTGLVCKEFATLRYLYDAEPGLLTGRHLGASVANGDILCFLDDDNNPVLLCQNTSLSSTALKRRLMTAAIWSLLYNVPTSRWLTG